jgi:hypothetical protein
MSQQCGQCARLAYQIEKLQARIARLDALLNETMHRLDRLTEYLDEEMNNPTVMPRKLVSDAHAQLVDLYQHLTDERYAEKRRNVV